MNANERPIEYVELPASFFRLLDVESPGYARLSRLPPVQVAVRRAAPSPAPKPVALSRVPIPMKVAAPPKPPLSPVEREIVALRKALGWPIPPAFVGRK